MPGSFLLQASDAAVYLLFGGAVGLLVSVLVVTRVLVEETDPRPGRRALAHWAPVAMTGLVAALLGHPEIGIGVAFGTSVAALSTIVGFLGITAAVDVIPPRARRIWTFLPVVTTLAFIIGFRGQLTLVEAIILAAQGALAMLMWEDPGEGWEEARVGTAGVQRQRIRRTTIAMAVAGLLLTAVAAWAATRGAEHLSQQDMRYPTGLLASTIISVVLIMPMIGTGVPLAVEGKAWSPITAQVGLVLLNVCVLVPVVILTSMLMAKIGAAPLATTTMPAATAPATTQATPTRSETETPAEVRPLLYPRTIWRIDAVTLLILSLVLLPIALGRFKLDKQVAGWLIVAYCVYLLSVLIANARGI
jgi:Ca2+/Na+ antiporter